MAKSTISLLLFLQVLCIISCTVDTDPQKNDLTSSRINEVLERTKDLEGKPALAAIGIIDSILQKYPKTPDSLKIYALFKKAIVFKKAEQLDSASLYFHRVINRDKEYLIHPLTIVYYRNTWEMDLEKGDASNAISTANSLVTRAQKEENNEALYYAYNALGRIYYNIRDINNSLDFSKKAYTTARARNDLNNEVIQASQIAQLLVFSGKKEQAYDLLNSYISSSKDYEDAVNNELFLNYGVVQFYKGNYKGSIDSYKTSIRYARKLDSTQGIDYNIPTAYVNIGESYGKLNNKPLEIAYIDSAMTFATTSGNLRAIRYTSKQQIISKFQGDSNINKLILDFDKLVVSQYEDYQTKIAREQKDIAIANEKEIQLIEEKTAAEIKSIKSRDRSIIIAIATGILLLLAYIIYQRRAFRFARQKLLIQQRLLRSQMNPHFTFNVLSTIQNQIKTNPQGAENYLVKFSRLLRLILENSTNDYVLLEKEIDSLHKYVQLQQIRFPNLFDFKIVYQNMKEDAFIFIPPMLLQPFVENSIEHGFDNIDYKGQIQITLSRKQNYLHCSIEDNGKGFNDSNLNMKNSLSTTLISKYLKDATNSKIDVINKRENDSTKNGLITQFLIPYKITDV